MDNLLKTIFILLIIYLSKKHLSIGLVLCCLFFMLYNNNIENFSDLKNNNFIIINKKLIDRFKNTESIKKNKDFLSKINYLENIVDLFGGELKVNKDIIKKIKDQLKVNNIDNIGEEIKNLSKQLIQK